MIERSNYVECDIPPGMTCAEYRRTRSLARRHGWRARIRLPRRRPR